MLHNVGVEIQRQKILDLVVTSWPICFQRNAGWEASFSCVWKPISPLATLWRKKKGLTKKSTMSHCVCLWSLKCQPVPARTRQHVQHRITVNTTGRWRLSTVWVGSKSGNRQIYGVILIVKAGAPYLMSKCLFMLIDGFAYTVYLSL